MYHLFSGHNYYPESGLGDYVGPYEDLALAEDAARSQTEDLKFFSTDWWVIVAEQDGRLQEVSRGYKEWR